jgi:hypothetical protein
MTSIIYPTPGALREKMRPHHRHLLWELPLIYRGESALVKRVKHRVARSKAREPQAVAFEISTAASEVSAVTTSFRINLNKNLIAATNYLSRCGHDSTARL